ncbi:MAG: PSD1 and planctomycete cytochrome C domain-containing protein [Planctomycetaceae bacterium]
MPLPFALPPAHRDRRALPPARGLAIFLRGYVGVVVLVCSAPRGPAQEIATADLEFFEKQVRPVLAEHCLECHGGKKQQGGFNLAKRELLLKGGDSGVALVPGKPDESPLLTALAYTGDLKMPPTGQLPASKIEALRQWVAKGAPWPANSPLVGDTHSDGPRAPTAKQATWWAFQPVRDPALPEVRQSAWPRNAIDRFVLANLEAAGLAPASEADRPTWIRRVTFDLTGLPPTPEAVAAFVADESPQAWERVVDRLLDSPAFGERWARHWLDVVRYADYHDFNPALRTASCEITEAWRYRDWVVSAFNRDLPFDQFIQHQIAGDLLPVPDGAEIYPDGLVATTFLSNGVWDRGDADKEKIVSDMVDDNIGVIGKAFLGLTLDCARCHDHKFDPSSQADYYALAGIFYSSHILKELGEKGGEYTVNRVPLIGPSELAERARREKELAAVKTRLADLDRAHRLSQLRSGGQPLVPTRFSSDAGAVGTVAEDHSVMVRGPLMKDRYTLEAVVPEGVDVKYLRLETLPDPELPAGGAGRADDGNFVLTRLSATVAAATEKVPATPVKFIKAEADFEQDKFPAASALDDNPAGGWAVSPHVALPHAVLFEIAAETPVTVGTKLVVVLEQQHAEKHALGRFRLSVTGPVTLTPAPESAERTELLARQADLQRQLADPVPLAMATTEGGTTGGLFPGIQDVPIHIRGSYARLGPVVPRRFPRFLAGEEQPAIGPGSGRRELAQWVASPANPLTARVIVNRIWAGHLGEGLVRTPNNFGLLSEPPSHPELLDWLASRLVDEGWSLKKLHRRIVLSATYRQSGQVAREVFDCDPENRLLGRFTPRRLEAEAIRDAVLTVNGRLDGTPGGPAGDDFTIRRRSLYVQTARWQRDSYAMLFDAANPDSSTEKRTTSTVAPQALLLLNHAWVHEQARHLAERAMAAVPEDSAARIEWLYQWLFARPPKPEELAIAREVVAAGDASLPPAGWIDLAHLLLCSNEFLYVD